MNVDNATYWRGQFDGDMIQASQPLVLECISASLNNALVKIKCGQLQSKLMDVAMAVPALKQTSQLANL